ncbi:MAG: type I-C CRISPR-associated protein Cas8c/Csd1 [Dehalococcoidia bacterium]|nr:type I-C CRISPR-associated protein Cas8c/Csd1 [Dehalococcoidia bacterium]
MLLQKLKEYADERMQLPPVLYTEAPVRYIIELDKDGRLLTSQLTDTADKSSPRTKSGVRRLVPRVQRTVNPKPLLLSDNGEYTLGKAKDPSKTQRVKEVHAAYLSQLKRCAETTREPAVIAVSKFLECDPLPKLQLEADFDPGANITFRVDGVFLVDLLSVQSFWAAENDLAVQSSKPAQTMQCLVCGEQKPALERLLGKIKGIPGGQMSGTAIISANAEAFKSYGLKASLIAPVCANCSERFTKAANELLATESSHLTVGNSVYVFWTRQKIEFPFRDFLSYPDPEQVKGLIHSVHTGRAAAAEDGALDTAFFAAALTASGGRAVVRDWMDTTVLQVRQNLVKWFKAQRIVGPYGEEPRPYGILALAAGTVRAGTVRDVRKNLPPMTPHSLLRCALAGTALPPGLLYQAVRRNRAEQAVTQQRATLIKLVLSTGSTPLEEEAMVQLDPANNNPAYHCGRLLAVIEQIQRSALPSVRAGVVARFYGTASSAPASVFGRLLKGAQPHLGKLERDDPPAWFALQGRLGDVLSGLKSFPKVLTLQEQGLFALGYYHQRAHDRAQAKAAGERRRAKSGDQDLEAEHA